MSIHQHEQMSSDYLHSIVDGNPGQESDAHALENRDATCNSQHLLDLTQGEEEVPHKKNDCWERTRTRL
jgi:hypothetical protein